MRWAGPWRAATDEGGIQFRILNASKGPAVRATRAQADRVLYKAAIRQRLENQPNLWLFQQAVDDLMRGGRPCGRRRSPRSASASGAGRGADGGHLPRRQDPRGAAELHRRARGRSAGDVAAARA